MNIPVAQKKTHVMTIHGDSRNDEYYWMRERESQEVIDYLEAENSYLESSLSGIKKFRTDLFEEMKARIKKDDDSVPYEKNGYMYWSRYFEGKEYPIYYRKKIGSDQEETLLDSNVLAKGQDFFALGDLAVSPNGQFLAYSSDVKGRNFFTIYVKDLQTGKLFGDKIENVDGGIEWANDNKTFFYVAKHMDTLRSEKVFRYRLGQNESHLVYHEKDETFYVSVSRTKTGKYLFIESGSTLSSESRFVDADTPEAEFTLFQPRQPDFEYWVYHGGDRFFVLTNQKAKNFKLCESPLDKTTMGNWKEVVAHRKDVYLENIEIYKDHLILQERENGLKNFKIINRSTQKSFQMAFDEATYNAYISTNAVYESNNFRFGYESMTTPSSVFDYDILTQKKELKKQGVVLGEFNKDNYQSERLMVPARDGVLVPVSIVYRKGLKKDGSNPVLLYGYGSYGASMNVYFSTTRLSLLDRGFVFAVAHIRGGADLGRSWYEDGKLLKKKNTFNDFIDCGKYMIEKKFTSSKHLYASGGSAGGLLMGAVMNMEPELFNGILADVPFVDVVTTMLDETIPLTTGEYDEWGNPNNKEYYDYMLSYSPYDNVRAVNYPHLLVLTGLHDSQVQYWEPAKWVAKLRELKTGNSQLYLKIDMTSGHGGASGRFEGLKDLALEYAFILSLEGHTE